MDRSVGEGKILALSISKSKGTPKNNVSSAEFVTGWGIRGDAHAGAARRQVSLLAAESIDKIRAKGLEVQPGGFAENITTVGVDLSSLSTGDQIVVGEVLLEVTRIGKECHERCAIYYKAGDCVMPKEGVFAVVHKSGIVRCNDTLRILRTEQPVRFLLPAGSCSLNT